MRFLDSRQEAHLRLDLDQGLAEADRPLVNGEDRGGDPKGLRRGPWGWSSVLTHG